MLSWETDQTEREGALKDLSSAAMCLLLPQDSPPPPRRGARVQILMEGPDGAPALELNGTVLYTLITSRPSRECVILFDRVREDAFEAIGSRRKIRVRL